MSNKVQTSLRLDAEKLSEAKVILTQLGLNFTDAVNIFTSMVVYRRGLPFDVVLPNDETQTAMQETRTGKNMESVTVDTLKEELNIEESSKA
ncbi:MAG: type II toxin-antitoxin system RelB/DinJ family antitoxin [Gammaproteobacteria bacterium]|nr:type II toxin-antitoxin system RelB/DinJ family antitoxin [Gammaproteobacteria bacterium]